MNRIEYVKGVDELKKLVSSLKETESMIIHNDQGVFVGSIYFKVDRWRYMLTELTIYDFNPEDECPRFLDVFLKDQNLTCVIMDRLMDMCHEIREIIRRGCESELECEDTSLYKIVEEVRPHLGKPVRWNEGEQCILVGVSATLEDYYYDLVTSTGVKLHFSSCVGSFTPVQEEDYSPETKSLLMNFEHVKEIRDGHFNDPLTTDIEIIGI